MAGDHARLRCISAGLRRHDLVAMPERPASVTNFTCTNPKCSYWSGGMQSLLHVALCVVQCVMKPGMDDTPDPKVMNLLREP